MIGQPQVTQTLSSQIRDNRLSHAYLFTGSRGTGKTTCAKILAKAVNCLHPVNGDPCNECEICKGIDNGTVLDIVEIDAASNRGIDDIRLLRDEANFMPSQAKYRVYIIDEVHMLTIEAFNALLKTLEEPPEHVKFILATTEVHKLPSTILSRCQRFDFRRIEPKFIAERLQYIANEEKAVLHEDAAMLIARIADGGMRDALSLLDRAISVDNEVTTAVVSSSAGLMGRDYIYDLIRAIAAGDTARSLIILDGLHNASCDTERLCMELSEQFRNFLIIKTVDHPENLIVCTAEELEELKKLSASFTSEQVLNALNVLTSAADAIKRTQNRRIEAEMALIRLCAPETSGDLSAMSARISVLEKELAELKANGIRQAPAASSVPVNTPAPARTAPPVRESDQSAAEPAFPADAPDFDDVPPAAEEPPFAPDDADLPFGPDTDAPPFVPDDAELPFGPDTGELPFGPDTGVSAAFNEAPVFEGFGSEPEIGSFNDRFAALDDEEDEPSPAPSVPVNISDDFMSRYGAAESASANAAETHTTDTAAVSGTVDSRTWVKIILATEQAHAPMIGQLTNSTAYIRGDTLFVRPANPFIKVMTKEALLAENMAPAVARILGKEYKIRYDEK